jgi:hypothetical protein
LQPAEPYWRDWPANSTRLGESFDQYFICREAMRMNMRWFTQSMNAFSKKFENCRHAIALYFVFYNFWRNNGGSLACDVKTLQEKGY